MKRLFFYIVALSWTYHSFSQVPTNQSMPTNIPVYLSGTISAGVELKEYGVIEAPRPQLLANFIVNGSAKVDLKAQNKIVFKPGVHLGNFSPGNQAYLNARIVPKNFNIAWFEPIENPGLVPKYKKLELGISLPTIYNNKINDFLNCNRTTEDCESKPNTINPFDQEELNIIAEFHSPDNRTIERYGFYYEEYERVLNSNSPQFHLNDDPTDPLNMNFHEPHNPYGDRWHKISSNLYNFRIRYSPDYLGYWTYSIKIYVNNNSTLIGEYYGDFMVTESEDKGYLVLDNNSKYLKYKESGESLFLTALNIDNVSMHHYPQSDRLHKEMLEEFFEKGGNYTELMMKPGPFGIEREELGNYASRYIPDELVYSNNNINTSPFAVTRQMNAWELDEKIEFIEKNNAYFHLYVDQPGFALAEDEPRPCSDIGGADWSWMPDNWYPSGGTNYGNPYRSSHPLNYGRTSGVDYLTDFFNLNNPGIAKYYNRKLRYISSRWGYGPHLLAYELFNEINWCCDGNPEVRQYRRNWIESAAAYLKQGLRDPHLVTYSYLTWPITFPEDEPFDSDLIDFVDVNAYNYGSARNYGLSLNENVKTLWNDYHKPVLIGEGGTPLRELYACDRWGLHNELWASAMSGTLGTIMHWNWMDYYYWGDYVNYTGISKFMQGVDFEWNNFTPHHTTSSYNLNLTPADDHIECLYLQNQQNTQIMGWVHNRSAYWANEPGDCFYFGNDHQRTFCPSDDPDCQDEANSIYSINPRVLLFENFDTDASIIYNVQWFDTQTGDPVGNIEETNTAFGTLFVQTPDLTTTHDIAFKVWPKYSDFKSSNGEQTALPTREINICSGTSLGQILNLFKLYPKELYISGERIRDTTLVFNNNTSYRLTAITIKKDTMEVVIHIKDCHYITNGINEPAFIHAQTVENNSFLVYPIPAGEYFFIDRKSGNFGKYDYFVYSSLGQVVRSGRLFEEATIIKTNDFAKGIYFLSISETEGKEKHNFKLTIQ
ncbi:MAG: T9SS type A sorting domain-containing protein [Bacteroidia bacterium]|nr:T9SS type A sorting domain-containing protein [Bacteroidia bacterium]